TLASHPASGRCMLPVPITREPTMHKRHRCRIIAMSLALFACSPDDGEHDVTIAAGSERDSAGVRIVEHALAARLASPDAVTWRLSDEASVMIGGHLHEEHGQDIHLV